MKQLQRYRERKPLEHWLPVLGVGGLGRGVVASKVHSSAARKATVGCEWWVGSWSSTVY